MNPPDKPKIYHILHIDRLPSVIKDGYLFCDQAMHNRKESGTMIGMPHIKQRRLEKHLHSHPSLFVGDCVPFNFCPRSVMLYIISKTNHSELSYRGGQDPIIHLEADLLEAVDWAEKNNLRWAFTKSNARADYSEDYCDLKELERINWDAVQTKNWQKCKEEKQAEFLLECHFPWHLITVIGTQSQNVYNQVITAVANNAHKPCVELKPEWYY